MLTGDIIDFFLNWFKHILFMTKHDKGLSRAKKLRLAHSISVNYPIACNITCTLCFKHILLVNTNGLGMTKL